MAVTLLLERCGGDKTEGGGVHAVSKTTSFLRSVREDVAEVAIRTHRTHFDAGPGQTVVGSGVDSIVFDWFGETREQ